MVYANNLVDSLFQMIDHVSVLSAGPEQIINHPEKILLSKNWEFLIHLRRRLLEWQAHIEFQWGPTIKGTVAVMVLIYLMTLIFSFAELFGATPEEEIIKLTEKEIDILKKKVDTEKAPEPPKEVSQMKLSFKPGKKNQNSKL